MKKSFIIILIFIAAFFNIGCENNSYETLTELSTVLPTEELIDEKQLNIGVYVCGQVINPGIYYFPENSRIMDAVNAAGGTTDKAALDSINLAEYIKDCDRIYVPSVDDNISTMSEIGTDDGKININEAGLEQLMTLPGIGQSKAQSIIDYRQEQGGFSDIEQLKNISGIKAGVFEKIKDMIKV